MIFTYICMHDVIDVILSFILSNVHEIYIYRAYESFSCNIIEWLTAHGAGEVIESNGDISINNPNALRAIKRAAKWIGDITPVTCLNYASSDTETAWLAGNAAFMRMWPRTIISSQKKFGDINVGVFRLPGEREGVLDSVYIVDYIVVLYSPVSLMASFISIY
jgi:hypothetical protein